MRPPIQSHHHRGPRPLRRKEPRKRPTQHQLQVGNMRSTTLRRQNTGIFRSPSLCSPPSPQFALGTGNEGSRRQRAPRQTRIVGPLRVPKAGGCGLIGESVALPPHTIVAAAASYAAAVCWMESRSTAQRSNNQSPLHCLVHRRCAVLTH